MSRTVLILSRGARLHHLFEEMAIDLARDHRVIVLTAPECVASFVGAGVDAREYAAPEMSEWRRGMGVDPSIDISDVAEIERELKLTVHKAASNYLLYGRIVRSYGGYWRYIEAEEDIVYTYVRAYRQLEELFRTERPDVVFFETLDVISSYVAMALAVRHGAWPLEFRFAPLGEGKIMPAYGLFRRNPLLEHLTAHPEEIASCALAAADDVLSAVTRHVHAASYSRVHRNMIGRNVAVSWRRLRDAARNPDAVRRGLRNARWHWRVAANTRWLDQTLAREPPKGRYVVFFMQHLPEATTCSQAPRWVYQDAVVEQLAINAPSGLTVVVKEHPRTYGYRGSVFFAPLQRLPNVHLCHPSVDTGQLIEGAEALLVVTSTVGLEGVLRGKRVAVLGRPFYSAYPGVRTIDHPADLFSLLEDATWRPEHMREQRRRFIAAYVQSLQDFGVGEGASVYPRTGGAQWARALRNTLEFLQTRGLRPADFDAGL